VWSGDGHNFTRAPEDWSEFVRKMPATKFVLEVSASSDQETRARLLVAAALAPVFASDQAD
jgi:hypothetical protein